jgi:hypothetical protein
MDAMRIPANDRIVRQRLALLANGVAGGKTGQASEDPVGHYVS